ncbi:MAG: septum formation initiator family protein [Bdellovibrionota bacterium]
MDALKRFFSIEKWTYKELLIFLAAFLLLNLLSPRGFVQWILIQQDIRRVKNEMQDTKERLADLEAEIKAFQRSDLIKEQKIRELGYLKPDEISLEFVDSARRDSQEEAARRREAQDKEKQAR